MYILYILYIYYIYINVTYRRWTSSLPSCLWSQRIFSSLPGSRLTIFLTRCKFSTLTTRQPMIAFYLLTVPCFPLRKKEHKSYFGKNRTHDFPASWCAVYLLDHSATSYFHTITPPPPPAPLLTQHPTYATKVTASLAQRTAFASKKENVILLKNNASITRPPSGRAPLTPLPRNARDFQPVFCPYFCYWPAAARHPGFQPLPPPSTPKAAVVLL